MKGKRWLSLLSVGLMLVLLAGFTQAQQPASMPLGTGFTYQGQLKSDGVPYTGTCDLRFILYDASIGGSQIGPIETQTGVSLTGGYLTVELDFGSGAFGGDARWLNIEVCCPTGACTYTPLTPRQELTASPYALYSTAAPWSGLSGVPAGFADGVDNDTTYTAGSGLALTGTIFSADTTYLQRRVSSSCPAGNAIRVINQDGTVTCEADDNTTYTAGTGLTLAGTTFSADTSYLQRRVGWCSIGSAIRVVAADGTVTCQAVDANAWQLTGNAGTTPGTDFVGTTDDQALELKVNDARALRLEPNAASPNLIGGYSGNSVSGGVYGATIGGGGASGYLNRVTDALGTVGGGWQNRAGDDAGGTTDAPLATVGGGWSNTASAQCATIGGGYYNYATGAYATVAGGQANTAGAQYAAVGGGYWNEATGQYATVCGGQNNTASYGYATVGGGSGNASTDDYATVGGGQNNTANNFATVGGGQNNTASGTHATIGGGWSNTASTYRGTVSGGQDNTASGEQATVGGGGLNTASGDSATVGGGHLNTASAESATVPGGYGAVASHYGEMAYASGSFSLPYGHAQASLYVMRRSTTSTGVWYDLYLDGYNDRLTLADGRTLTFDILVAGRTSAGESGGYRCYGVIERVVDTTTLLGSSCQALGEDDIAWDVRVFADNSSMALSVQVMGNGETIRWVATVRTTEVSYP